jgi:hypothetical protein
VNYLSVSWKAWQSNKERHSTMKRERETLGEKYSFRKMETIWKPCVNLMAKFHIRFPQCGNFIIVSASFRIASICGNFTLYFQMVSAMRKHAQNLHFYSNKKYCQIQRIPNSLRMRKLHKMFPNGLRDT